MFRDRLGVRCPDLAEADNIEGKFRNPSIRDLKQGSGILVQVTKEPMGAKGARLSTQISPPINSTRRLHMVSPSPVPPYFLVVELSAWEKA